VRRSAISDGLSKRVPAIAAFTLCAALVADWVSAPVWLPRGLAVIVGGLALMVLAARGRRYEASEDPDSDRSWIAYELAGKGTPAGFYPLGFFAIVTIVLTGTVSPYSLPAWAALGLGIAWGIANAHYPADDE
jgi:hypothetical protein